MDMGTVLTIIEMIDARVQWTINDFKINADQNKIDAQQEVLNELKDYLQSCIENQLNGAENNTGE